MKGPRPTREERIARLAYEMWEAGGKEHGDDLWDWLTAEKSVDYQIRCEEQEKERARRSVIARVAVWLLSCLALFKLCK